MRHARLTITSAILGMSILSGCNKTGEKKALTREVFTAAVSKCQPLDAKFVSNAEGPPSVEITVPDTRSTVPDCMAKEFDGYALKDIKITIDRSRGA